jgi:acetyl esterase/lipase
MFTRNSPERWRQWVSIGSSPAVRATLLLVIAGTTMILVRGEPVRPDLPAGVRLVADLRYRKDEPLHLALDLYFPRRTAPPSGWPVIVALHGGGWRGGSKGEFGRSLVPLVERGLVVAAVDYRLSRPGAPSWPGNLEDVRAAVRWLRQHAAEYGLDPEKLALLGASAGGQLALLVGLDHDEATRPSAVVDLYAPTDLRRLRASRPVTDESISLLLGASPNDAPDLYVAASPIQHVTAGAPPILILHGTDDAVVPIEQSRALAATLERAGVFHRTIELPGQRHGFGLVAGKFVLEDEIHEFLTSNWKSRDYKSLQVPASTR